MNKIMKALAFGLTLSLILGLCGCGSSDSDSESDGMSSQSTEKKAAEKTEFKVGETWTVNGQWSITVTGVSETKERNEFEEKEPAAVYMVDYTYSNLGYEDETGMMDGLYVTFEDGIVDAEGSMGYAYPNEVSDYAQETPVGASCKAQNCIGVDHAGTFSVDLTLYDSESKEHKAKFIMEPGTKADAPEESQDKTDKSSALPIGETWTVPDQWELTINGVKKSDERNEYEDKKPAAVYIVDYTYKNLGYEDSSGAMDGLYFSLEDSIVDAEGSMGYSYPNEVTDYPQETPIGANCKAQACIGVDHAGSFTINVIMYDGNEEKQTQSFYVEVK